MQYSTCTGRGHKFTPFKAARQHANRHGVVAAAQHGMPASAEGQHAVTRRQAMQHAALLAAAVLQMNHAADAAVDSAVQFKELKDETLAYSFQYPTQSTEGRSLPFAVSRRPERYSSAAPLTPDARQRIVCELADLKDAITLSVAVGPAAGVLAGRDPGEWRAREVGDAVLIDKSTARITTGQRVSLSVIESSKTEQRDGETYWVYEHVAQKSATTLTSAEATYRHALSVTACRRGLDGKPYLYSYTFSCPDELWDELEEVARSSVASFRLNAPTRKYVSPDQEPWRFF